MLTCAQGTRRCRVAILAVAALTLLATLSSTAQSGDTGLGGFNLNVDHFTPDVSGVHSIYGSQTLGHLNSAVRLSLGDSGGLIEASNPVNNRRSAIVDNLFVGDISAAVGLGNHVDLGLVLPIVLYERMENVNTQIKTVGYGLGDILIDAKFRILKDKKKSIGLGILTRLSMPTGSTSMFTGWKDPTGEFRLISDKTISSFYVSANVGYRIAAKTNVRNETTGAAWNLTDDDRLTFGVGASYALPVQNRSWALLASLDGDTVVGDIKEISTPLGFAVGVRKSFDNGMSLEIGGGRGITDAVGSPSYRVFGSFAFDGGRLSRAKKQAKIAAEVANLLNESVYFAFDSTSLPAEAMTIIKNVVTFMEKSPLMRAAISGHTDSTGNKKYNYKLGMKRARSVAEGLESSGISDERIELKSYGETNPVSSNDTAAGRAKNRRVVIDVR